MREERVRKWVVRRRASPAGKVDELFGNVVLVWGIWHECLMVRNVAEFEFLSNGQAARCTPENLSGLKSLCMGKDWEQDGGSVM